MTGAARCADKAAFDMNPPGVETEGKMVEEEETQFEILSVGERLRLAREPRA